MILVFRRPCQSRNLLASCSVGDPPSACNTPNASPASALEASSIGGPKANLSSAIGRTSPESKIYCSGSLDCLFPFSKAPRRASSTNKRTVYQPFTRAFFGVWLGPKCIQASPAYKELYLHPPSAFNPPIWSFYLLFVCPYWPCLLSCHLLEFKPLLSILLTHPSSDTKTILSRLLYRSQPWLIRLFEPMPPGRHIQSIPFLMQRSRRTYLIPG